MPRNNKDFINEAFNNILKVSYPKDMPGFEGTTDALNKLTSVKKTKENPDRSTRLEEGAVCSGSGCGKPATKFTWEGNLCDDCWGPGGRGK